MNGTLSIPRFVRETTERVTKPHSARRGILKSLEVDSTQAQLHAGISLVGVCRRLDEFSALALRKEER
jgi:hypothetical protein